MSARHDGHERDAELDAQWRQHSQEVPPPRIDAAILAAAHREVGARPRAVDDAVAKAEARGPSHWWWGLAAAATVGAVAFGIVQLAPLVPSEPSEPPHAVSDVPPGTGHPPAQSPSLPAPAASIAPPAQQRSEAPELRRESAAPAPSAVMPAPPPSSVSPSGEPSSTPPRARMSSQQSQPASPPARKPADAAAEKSLPQTMTSRPARRDEPSVFAGAPIERERRELAASSQRPQDAELAPEAWIASIVKLLDAGQRDEAARQLTRFRAAYPDADARLPESLRGWARTVKR